MMRKFVKCALERLFAKLHARRVRRGSIPIEVLPLEARRLLTSTVVTVNAAANVHAIDPNIYGAAFATQGQVSDLNLTINRSGGNTTNTYNWQQDASNHANDYFYESIADGTGNGQSMDTFVSDTKAGGAQPDLTIPIVPYVASLGPGGTIVGSYPVSVYGPQQSTDPYRPEYGNGVTPNGQDITDTNPLSNYVANSPAFEQGWIQHLLDTFGTPANGGVQYFTLGNEPGLWNSTNRDIHPNGETNSELLSDIINYASMIKSIDPHAQILGPEEWGWPNYFLDGADNTAENYGATYGGLNVQQWLLQQLAQYQTANGVRLLDDFTLHYYPQEPGVDTENVDHATELLRNQVTRSFWDPNYVDPSWIGGTGINDGKINLIPMMHSWVNTYYPGTKIGITEYRMGAEGDMNGATAQADVYGIFGQQGLNLATRWTTPTTNSPTYLAMKLWRNYDGNDSGFGDTSVSAPVANPDQTDAFSAIRTSDGALTVAVINKNLYDSNNPTATTSITINLSGFANTGVAQEWQLSSVNPSNQSVAAISHLSDIHFTGNSITLTVPMESVSMFVIKPAAAPVIGTNPLNQSVIAGQTATFTASAAGTPAPTVQWQQSTDGGANFTNVAGATSTTYSFTAAVGQDGWEYRAAFTNANGTVKTTAATLTVHVANHAPVGTSVTLTAGKNVPYTFKAVDFGFTDPGDSPPNALLAVKFPLLGNAGTVTDHGVAVTTNQFVSAADINSGKLVYTPAANLVGGPFFVFKFQVQDNGGTANGRINLDPSAKVFDVKLVVPNHAPVGTQGTIVTPVNIAYSLKAADFGFTDPADHPPNTLSAVKLTLFGNAGTLRDNGVAVTANQIITLADITSGKLAFTPTLNLLGGPFFLCKFQVQDNGGTAFGGANLDPTARVLYVNVVRVNHAPAGTQGTVTMRQNTAYTFKTADFGFTDPNDNPPNSFLAATITLLTSAGTLTDNGVAVTVNQFVSVADIAAGKLVFTPKANLVGGPLFLGKFSVQDNGGTAYGGKNLDPSSKVLYFNSTR